MAKKSTITSEKQLPGISLERLVARIQQMVDPNSTVTQNEVLEDRVGNRRQYDVVIRGQFGGRPMLGIIECKDHSRRKGPDAVEAFAKKCDNLGANLRLMVSRKGFTERALKLAKFEQIGCLSVLTNDARQSGFSIGDWWYGEVNRWTDLRVVVVFQSAEVADSVGDFDGGQVRWQGLPVMDWFKKELYTTLRGETGCGRIQYEIAFSQLQQLEIAGAEYPVIGLVFLANGVRKNKRIWVSWSGDAFYDWHSGTLTLPNRGRLVGSLMPSDIDEWDDFDGEIPDLSTDRAWVMRSIWRDAYQWDASKLVPDLLQL